MNWNRKQETTESNSIYYYYNANGSLEDVICNDEAAGSKAVNFRDYAELMLYWIDKQFWPL